MIFRRKKNLFLFLLPVVAGIFILTSFNAKAVDCQLNSVAWASQTVVVGQEVLFNATGQNCSGWEVSFNIYEKDPLSNDFITTVKAKFTTSLNSVVSRYTFTVADYTKGGNESGSETMIIEAVAGTSKVKTQSDLTLQKPASGSCQLSTAQWRWSFKDQPIEGSPMDLVVNGTGCPNFVVNIEVKEQDVGLGDDSMGFVSAKFSSQGTQAIGKWTVDGSKDDDDLGSYMFYFEAAAGSSKVTSNTLQIPLRSKSGCLNCNAVTAPNPCECADGFTGDRGFGGTCDNVCKTHIGDAQGGANGGGGGGTGGGAGECGTPGQPACPAGQTKTYSFSIPNPLKGGASDLASLVKVLAQWVFNLAVPIAVAMIVYAGVLFLTAQGSEQKVTKAKDVLKWAVVGLAIILIGSGFITLIQSILELGSDNTTVPGAPVPTGPDYGPIAPGTVGNKCSADRDCLSVLKCGNGNICQRPTGNLEGEWCKSIKNCDVGFGCDLSSGSIREIDGQILGLCFAETLVGSRIGDVCQKDSECISGLKCNQICQRKDGNLNGEACLKTSNPSNCQSRACLTSGADRGVCTEYSGT